MPSHSDAVAAAGQSVIAAAVAERAHWDDPDVARNEIWAERRTKAINATKQAVYAYNALVAATCATCGGTGKKLALTAAEEAQSEWEDESGRVFMPCPAGCDNGRTR